MMRRRRILILMEMGIGSDCDCDSDDDAWVGELEILLSWYGESMYV
jgi:hypothetical protein